MAEPYFQLTGQWQGRVNFNQVNLHSFKLIVLYIINDLVSTKSPGYDDTSPKVITAVIDSIHLPLCDIFNKSLQIGCFPVNLKIAMVYKGDVYKL